MFKYDRIVPYMDVKKKNKIIPITNKLLEPVEIYKLQSQRDNLDQWKQHSTELKH